MAELNKPREFIAIATAESWAASHIFTETTLAAGPLRPGELRDPAAIVRLRLRCR
ncbi:protein of unknown function [Methylocella tundrae]|uniref:Uncharacterized protein n=1 Tax=Methylocella tundrae TaxID=227605 RepID=A0A4U8Z1D0_METTU|nr:protein of unknown function [Methylocella tundrae]